MCSARAGGEAHRSAWRSAANGATVAAGCVGAAAIQLRAETGLAVALVLLAAMLDAVDGPMARRAGGGTLLGRRLDAVADFVAFAVAPVAIVLAAHHQPGVRHGAAPLMANRLADPATVVLASLAAGAAVYVGASAGRLVRQHRGGPAAPAGYHTGLPMPGAASLYLALGLTLPPLLGLPAAAFTAALALGRRLYPGPAVLLRSAGVANVAGVCVVAVLAVAASPLWLALLPVAYALGPLLSRATPTAGGLGGRS